MRKAARKSESVRPGKTIRIPFRMTKRRLKGVNQDVSRETDTVFSLNREMDFRAATSRTLKPRGIAVQPSLHISNDFPRIEKEKRKRHRVAKSLTCQDERRTYKVRIGQSVVDK